MNPWGTQWQPAWYPQQNQHPHVYIPPQYPNYWDQAPWGIPSPGVNSNYAAAEQRSTKYPDLNPILAADTTLLRFDVAKRPQQDITASTYQAYGQTPATATPVTHIRIISKSFPWSIDIKAASRSAAPFITCDHIWDALYSALQENIADSEWGLIVTDGELKKRVESAAKKRDHDDGRKLKRIDLLGRATMFKGLEKDRDFARDRLLPGSDPCADTWVVRLSMP